MKRRTIDALGCAVGAYFMKPPEIARAYALEVTADPGATVLGTSHRTAPELAAFANGVMVRYLDFNDTSISKKTGHPSNNIPPVLAVAEYADTDIRTAITAIVLAYEVQDRLGEVCGIMDNGWDHATYLAISSAAGAGKALGLTRKQMADSLAMAATANVALLQTRVGKLSMWKGCAGPNATRNGVFAALMARRGLEGPEDAFEGERGFLKQLSRSIELPTFGGDGQPFKIQYDKFKFFPCDYEAQCAIHPALKLHQVLRGQVDEIEKVDVEAYHRAVEISADTRDKWNPATRETADHSLPYVLAVALTNGTVWIEDFTEERIRNPKLHTLMQKIKVHSNNEFTKEYPEASHFRIKVLTRSGEQYVQEIRYPKGHPKNPMTDQEIETKFRRLADPVLHRRQVDLILDRLWHLDEVQNLQEVLALFEL